MKLRLFREPSAPAEPDRDSITIADLVGVLEIGRKMRLAQDASEHRGPGNSPVKLRREALQLQQAFDAELARLFSASARTPRRGGAA